MRYRKEGARALGCSSVSRRRAMMMKSLVLKSEIVPKASSERSRKTKKRNIGSTELVFRFVSFLYRNF